MPGGENFFFALARIREAPAFVKELKRRFVSGERSEQLMNAVERQRDEGLMRLILDQRETLGQNWQSRLAHQLETTMNLGLGRDIGAWANELNPGAE